MVHAPKSTTPVRPLFLAENLDVTTLNAIASSALPTGFSVARIGNDGSAAELYAWDGSAWQDDINCGPVTSTDINGPVRFGNPSSTDISFAW